MCPHSVTVKRKSIWLQWAIIGHNRDEADSQERDWETCELETSAVHHGILRPTFSLQEQHRCPRITYTDASLHLHSAVLLLPEQKLLLGVDEEGGMKKETRTWDQPPWCWPAVETQSSLFTSKYQTSIADCICRHFSIVGGSLVLAWSLLCSVFTCTSRNQHFLSRHDKF